MRVRRTRRRRGGGGRDGSRGAGQEHKRGTVVARQRSAGRGGDGDGCEAGCRGVAPGVHSRLDEARVLLLERRPVQPRLEVVTGHRARTTHS